MIRMCTKVWQCHRPWSTDPESLRRYSSRDTPGKGRRRVSFLICFCELFISCLIPPYIIQKYCLPLHYTIITNLCLGAGMSTPSLCSKTLTSSAPNTAVALVIFAWKQYLSTLCSCLHNSFYSWSRSAHLICAMTYLWKVIKDKRSTDKSQMGWE